MWTSIVGDEPKRDLERGTVMVFTSWLVGALVAAEWGLRMTSVPAIALGLALVPAIGPWAAPSYLPVVRYVAATVTSINGALLTFLAAIAFGAAAADGRGLNEMDARWILAVAVAAVVSAAGTGVVVRRTQLLDGHAQWAQARELLEVVRRSRACEPRRRASGSDWFCAAVLLWIGARRRR